MSLATLAFSFFYGFFVFLLAGIVASTLYFLVKHPVGTIKVLSKTVYLYVISLGILVGSLISLAITVLLSPFILLGKLKASARRVNAPLPACHVDSAVVVHLVHGTFEPNAAWTKEDSLMREQILLRNPGVVFNRFVWSGGNWRTDRSRAAAELAQVIASLRSKKQFIVAHSHGGNIVREMSRSHSHIAPKIAGVALLSTPFITRKLIKRKGGEMLLLHGLGLLLTAQAIAFLLYYAACHDWHGYHWLGLPVAALAMFADIHLSKKVKAPIDEELKETDAPEIDFRNVELFQAIGDEADVGLRLTSALHEACLALFGDLAEANRQFRTNLIWSHAMGVVIQGLVLAYLAPKNAGALYPLLMTFGFGLLFAIVWYVVSQRKFKDEIAATLMMIGLPIAFVAFFLNLIKSVAFGDIRHAFYPEAFMHSSETPIGDWRVMKFAPSSDASLIHSTHSEPKIIRQVAAWIEGSRGRPEGAEA